MQALLHSVNPTLQQATTNPCLCQRLLDTRGQVRVSHLWGHCSFLLGPGAHKVLFMPSKSLFPQSCVRSGSSMVGLMATSSKRAYAILRSVAPKVLPLRQAAADPHLHRRHSNTVSNRYTYLNTEFQRIARRDKKAFLGDQCKEIEENNRRGKTRDLFKKIRYQGNISCEDGLDKGQKW